MKKFFRILPVLIALLAVLFLFMPAQNTTGTVPAEPLTAVDSAEVPEQLESAGGSETTESATEAESASAPTQEVEEEALLPEDGSYTTKEDVALYLVQYGHLPSNFITKREAQAAGWNGGSLEKILPGMCIGGDRFGNYEGLLPKQKGRTWTECDINTLGKSSRGAERIVFSNDGLIYYTDDHYDSFTRVY